MPRAFTGFVLTIELWVCVYGAHGSTIIAEGIRGLRNLIGDAPAAVAAALALLVIATVGAEFARIILVPIRWGVGAAIRRLGSLFHSEPTHILATLGMTPIRLAVALFNQHEQFVSDFYQGYSRGNSESADVYTVVVEHWPEHFALLRSAFDSLGRGPLEMWRLAYYAQVTQEQALADYEETLVETVQTLWVALALVPLVTARSGGDGRQIMTTSLAAAAMALLLIPTYIKRKLVLAWYLVHVHAFTFIFGEAADVVDREAE
jgi:hypothetical protein